MRGCATCRHWKLPDTEDSSDMGGEHIPMFRTPPYRTRGIHLTHPVDPDTCEPMALPFEVRECRHPDLLFCERPLVQDGFAVADGSEFFAALYTAEDFGCVRHEERQGGSIRPA